MVSCVFITCSGPNGPHPSLELGGEPVSPNLYKAQGVDPVVDYLRLKKNPRFYTDLITNDALGLSSSLLLASSF